MKRTPTKNNEPDDKNSIWLQQETLRRLTELQDHNDTKSLEAVIEEAVEHYASLKSPREVEIFKSLSPRLREVLSLIAEGRSTKEIATQLKVSKKTVEFHRAQLVKKLGIRAVALITRFAVRVGAVRP